MTMAMRPTNPKSNRQIAIKAAIDPAFFHRIIHRQKKCPPALACRLAVITGIPREVWVFEPERLSEMLAQLVGGAPDKRQ